MVKEDIDKRILEWVAYVINNKIYKSESAYLRELGIPSNKFSDVRNGKTRFTATDIGKILKLAPELNANWIMAGRGNMLFTEDSSYNTGQMDLLRSINNDLIIKIEYLNNKIGALEARLSEYQKRGVQLDIDADNAAVDSYELAK